MLEGFLMHGVAHVVVVNDDGEHVEIATDRVYQWNSGAATIYRAGEPWQWIPPRRVFAIVGSEQG